MRGLMESSESNAIWLAVKHHSIVQESKTEKEGFKLIKVTNPRTGEEITKYIKRYKGLEALITKLEWRDTGDQYEQRYMGWKLHLDADGTPCVLDLPYINGSPSRVTTRFMKCAENINYSEPVEFRAWHDAKTDSTAFFIGQGHDADGKTKSVPQKYTRDDPGDCPPPIQKRNGKWNFDDQSDWLHDRMLNVVVPMVEAANVAREEGPAETTDDDNEPPPFDRSEPEFIDDDLVPF